jgi:hypothetical protein
MSDDQRRLETALDYYLNHALAAGDPERSAYEALRDGPTETKAAVRRLLIEAEQAGLAEIDLDELVFNSDQRASTVNNGGLEAQIGFIAEMLGVEGAERELRRLIAPRTPAASGEVVGDVAAAIGGDGEDLDAAREREARR